MDRILLVVYLPMNNTVCSHSYGNLKMSRGGGDVTLIYWRHVSFMLPINELYNPRYTCSISLYKTYINQLNHYSLIDTEGERGYYNCISFVNTVSKCFYFYGRALFNKPRSRSLSNNCEHLIY